jgi:phage baseplate assembly protein W
VRDFFHCENKKILSIIQSNQSIFSEWYHMKGMNAQTGQHLDGFDHLKQSIADILRTPVGSRVMLRDYGSNIPRLVDAPMNPKTIPLIYAATAEALDKWEPRLKLQRVQVLSVGANGTITLSVEGVYYGTEPELNGRKVSLSTEILR